jgi:hypothetical protein
MSAHFVQGDVKGVKQQDGSPRNTNPFFVMLGFPGPVQRAQSGRGYVCYASFA